MKYFIVWNEDKTEGVIFNDEQDARETMSGNFGNPSSALGQSFFELYGDDDDDELSIQEIDLAALSSSSTGKGNSDE